MHVIAITARNEDFAIAVVQLHELLDPEFEAEIKIIWGNTDEDEMLAAQTFVAWFRAKSRNKDKTLEQCLENEEYCWNYLEVEIVR